jgi:microcin C transport system substrate-binding protein
MRPNLIAPTSVSLAVFALVLSPLVFSPLAWQAAQAQHDDWHHATALVGEPKYPPDFKHFDYVNPDAPKGGKVREAVTGTFNNFNLVVQKGDLATGLGLIYDSLMASSGDEISAMYGQIADGLRYPADYSSVTFRLREEARWHDGKPITADDVIWSFENLTKIHPFYRKYYEHVIKVETTSEREVTFTFDQPGNKELPHIVGQITVLPKHWWEGKDANGKQRDISKTTQELPLGSGPYRLKKFSPGRTIFYERVADYWGKDLPVSIGQNNFDEIQYEYFRDDTVRFEAFKADKIDFRNENQAKRWATAYDFPAVRDGRVIIEEFAERGRGVGVGWIYNLRREKFQDVVLRRALNLAFNFEEMNRATFFDQYERIDSYHFGSELRSSGIPKGKELEILETVRGQIPEALFTEPYRIPRAKTATDYRNNLREAVTMLRKAGYKLERGKLIDPKGNPVTVEYLYLGGSSFERIALRLKQDLARIGVELIPRPVDPSQFQERQRNWDFDVIINGWGQSLSPGNEQLEFFGSKAADLPSSRNFGGIKDAAVDELINRIIFAKERDELIAATMALDRVLLWNEFILPTWTIRFDRTARWDRFGRPPLLPVYAEPAFPTIWWWDADKAKAVAAKK